VIFTASNDTNTTQGVIMKDKFNRAKQFVAEHPVSVVYGAGVLMGAGVTMESIPCFRS
jgi:hypothetical protein